MKKYKKVLKEVAVCSKVICNRCGKEITPDVCGDEGRLLSVEKVWGYGSAKDGVKQTFELCEECYDEIVARFKIPPEEV